MTMSTVVGRFIPPDFADGNSQPDVRQVSVTTTDHKGNAALAVAAHEPAIKQIIVVDGGTTYIGSALPGTETIDAAWRVKRVVVDGGTTTIDYALNEDDIATFDQVWDDGDGTDYTDLTYG